MNIKKRSKNFKNRKDWVQNKKQVSIGFCSQSFSKQDNQFLISLLKNIGIQASLSKGGKGTGWMISIPQSFSNKFFQIIGPCPVKSMQYKWKII